MVNFEFGYQKKIESITAFYMIHVNWQGLSVTLIGLAVEVTLLMKISDVWSVDNWEQQNITLWWVYGLCSVLFKPVNPWVNQFL